MNLSSRVSLVNIFSLAFGRDADERAVDGKGRVARGDGAAQEQRQERAELLSKCDFLGHDISKL